MGLMDSLRGKLNKLKKSSSVYKVENKTRISDESIWELFDLLKGFVDDKDILLDSLKKGNLEWIFLNIEKYDRIKAYVQIFYSIPDCYKYDLFVHVYANSEYKFNGFNDEIIDKIQQIRPREITNLLLNKADSNGDLILYRGESTKSSNVEEAISWTLVRGTAIWFAKRSGVGCLYIGKANIFNVITYIEERNEEEILIRYKDVQDIVKKSHTECV